jgi:hypothetical protein
MGSSGNARRITRNLSNQFELPAIFYALALLEAVDHRDKTYARQIKAAAIMEPIDRAQPNHPGLAHYIVHAYDFEPLAARGVSAADKYARVAPSAPHAQHMPSHIYSMLGRWEDSIRSNQAAVKASREYAAQNFPGTTFSQEPHAQDFMAYAYLQLGQNREAKRVVDEVTAIKQFSGARIYGRETGQTAPAARYVLERAAWSDLSCNELESSLVPWTLAIMKKRANRREVVAELKRIESHYIPSVELKTFFSTRSTQSPQNVHS